MYIIVPSSEQFLYSGDLISVTARRVAVVAINVGKLLRPSDNPKQYM
jgi:hypothetical protein